MGIQDHPGVTVISLSDDVLDTNELLGREFRAVRKNPASSDEVFLTGTVISHLGTEIHIQDTRITDPQDPQSEVNAIAYFWGEGELDKEQSAVPPDRKQCFRSGTFASRTLHEGYLKGVIDSIPGTGEWTQNGWQQQIGPYLVGEGCTYLRVNHGPFDAAWMFTPRPTSQPTPWRSR